MRLVIEFLFPKRLARLSYFIRVLLWNGVAFFLYQDAWGETALGIVAQVATLAYAGFFILLPRIRDVGMGAWWIVLAFIPFVSAFLGVVLLFRRTSLEHNPLFQRSPGASIPSRPDAATGT